MPVSGSKHATDFTNADDWTGKTFWMNQIAGTRLPSGTRIRTKGLSCKFANEKVMSALFVDSAGSHNPAQVTDNLTLEQAMVRQLSIGHLITKALFDLATIHIVVINELTFAKLASYHCSNDHRQGTRPRRDCIHQETAARNRGRTRDPGCAAQPQLGHHRLTAARPRQCELHSSVIKQLWIGLHLDVTHCCRCTRPSST
jgi:hypothetical protein